jgi:hypothetical protein
MCTYMYILKATHVYKNVYVYTYLRMNTNNIYIYACKYMYIWVNVCIQTYVDVFIFIYIHVRAYLYMNMIKTMYTNVYKSWYEWIQSFHMWFCGLVIRVPHNSRSEIFQDDYFQVASTWGTRLRAPDIGRQGNNSRPTTDFPGLLSTHKPFLRYAQGIVLVEVGY